MIAKTYIPKRIKVGFQNRDDTYTKKLAYVIYFDDRNVLRKETSWKRWIDKNIPTVEFDNEPMSGFVLNKKTGDYKSDWNHRKAHIRIYDPRDFETEIEVDNLLFILQECSSIKGKGVEGEFVYAFQGGNLILMPVTSQEHKQAIHDQTVKFKRKDLIPGCIYQDKKNNKLMYLGFEEYLQTGRNARGYLQKSNGKENIFVVTELSPKHSWQISKVGQWVTPKLDKLRNQLTTEPDTEAFPEAYKKYIESVHGTICDKLEFVPEGPFNLATEVNSQYYTQVLVKHEDNFYKLRLRPYTNPPEVEQVSKFWLQEGVYNEALIYSNRYFTVWNSQTQQHSSTCNYHPDHINNILNNSIRGKLYLVNKFGAKIGL